MLTDERIWEVFQETGHDQARFARAIESEVLQAQEPVAFPDLPAGIVLHSQLGELYDRLQVQQYALRYADASAPQPPAPCPDCESRANGYSVLVPSAELKKLQAKVVEQDTAYEALDEQRNRDFETIAQQAERIAELEQFKQLWAISCADRDMLKEVAVKQAALIEQCEKALKKHGAAYLGHQDEYDAAIAAIAAHKGQP